MRNAGFRNPRFISRGPNGERRCYKCKQFLPPNNFDVDRSRFDGLAYVCKDCRYRRAKPGPSQRDRKVKFAAGFSWCRLCKDWKLSSMVHAGLCRPHINAENRRRYAESSRFRMERRQHAHSRKRGVAPIPPEAQEMILEEFDGVCAYCDAKAQTWDHIVPIVEGGGTTPGNIVPACTACNSSKKHRKVFEWLKATNRTPTERFLNRYILSECGLWG